MSNASNSNSNYQEHEQHENNIINDEKIQSYLKELLLERINLSKNHNKFPNSERLLEQGELTIK
jgi:hypothetical protein